MNEIEIAAVMLSVIGAPLAAKKKSIGWLLWIVADLLFIPLFWYKHMIATVVLYVYFTITSVIGYRESRNSE